MNASEGVMLDAEMRLGGLGTRIERKERGTRFEERVERELI